MKRKIILFLAAFAAVVLTCGCRSAGKQNVATDPAETETVQPAAQDPEAAETGLQPAVGETEAPAADPAANETDKVADSELKAVLDPIARDYGATGVQAVVIRNGALYAGYEYGWAEKAAGREVRRDTKFRCASLSKLTVAMVTAALVDDGKMSWDSDVGDLLGYPVRNPSAPDTAITPRMLLSHTSSIIDSEAFLSSRNAGSSVPLSTLLSSGAAFAGRSPGSGYAYSNFGVALLAAAEESLTGVRFDELASDRLFLPLRMDAAYLASALKDREQLAALYTGGAVSYSIERQLSEQAAPTLGQTHHLYQGNLTLSAADYAKLLMVLLNDGVYRGREIISADAVSEITGVQYVTGSVTDGAQGLGEYRLAEVVPGRMLHCHTGSNFGMYACFAFDPADDSGVVIFTSGANASMDSCGVYNVHADMLRAIYGSLLA